MRIAIRADASREIGAGHFMRCLALARALLSHGDQVLFVARQLPPHLVHLAVAAGCRVQMLAGEPALAPWSSAQVEADAAATREAIGPDGCDWIVVDHYALGAYWERAVRPTGGAVLVIDDLADRDHDCEVLVDQNLAADGGARYDCRVPAASRRLLGPRFALLRAEFAEAHQTARPRNGSVRRVLVSFGGTDHANYTALALDALEQIDNIEADIVIGLNHPQRDELQARCQDRGHRCHIQIDSIAALMGAADLAIGAGGSSTWERCCVGLPTVTVVVANNQRQLVAEAAAAGLIHAPDIAGDVATGIHRHTVALMEAPALREAMSRAGLAAVDGLGAERVAAVLRGGVPVRVRPAAAGDADRLRAWRNQPRVRESSRSSAEITTAEHVEWLRAVLANPDRPLLIGQCSDADIGVVRFDISGDEAEVSIYLAPEYLGRGAGGGLLAAAEEWLRCERPTVRRLCAEVLGENTASHRLFAAAGYSTHATRYAKSC